MNRILVTRHHLLVAFVVLIFATTAKADPIGTIDFVTGHVSLAHLGIKQTPQEGTKVAEGDSFVTESDGEIHLDMVDGAALSVRSGSSLTISKYGLSENDSILISLSKGALRSVTGWLGHLRPSRYTVQTPNATIGIRGTDHETTYEPDGESAGTYERVFKGGSFVQDSSGKTVDATPGIAVAGNRSGNGFRNVGEQELPKFIFQRARHDDRFEKRFSQKSEQRIRERFSHHLSELKKQDPAAARRLRRHMDEKYPHLHDAQTHDRNTAVDRSEAAKANNTSDGEERQRRIGQKQEKDRKQQISQRPLRRQELLQRQQIQNRRNPYSASSPKRNWKRKPKAE